MKKFVREVWSLAVPYFTRSHEKSVAWLLLCVIIVMNLTEVYLNVRFSEWNKDFYDSLQNLDSKAFYSSLKLFCTLAAIYIANGVYKLYLNQMLQNRWRLWLTNEYVGRWLGGQAYYRMQMDGKGATDNPDQRISEDVRDFIGYTLGLTLGLLSAGVTLFSFLTMLWMASGAFAFTVAGVHVNVPGYMVWVALGYAVVGTWLTAKVGHPLILLNFNQQRYEADFRFSMARLRENAEGVALYAGEAREKEGFLSRFTQVYFNYWEIMKRQKKLTWLTSGYGQIAIIFPYLVTAPRFFAKQIKLGDMTQTATFFGQVQGSLSFIVNAYTDIAAWKAVVDRLAGFTAHMQEARPRTGLDVTYGGTDLSLQGVGVSLPSGRALLDNVDVEVAQGGSLLVKGPSGCGKSTLLRALAGLWPYAKGAARLPDKAQTLFLPQKPYLPIASLREVLCYPQEVSANDDALKSVLAECGLSHLQDYLDTEDNWAQVLSPGEQQRVGFARALLANRACVFLDEATSALDVAAEARLYSVLREKLPRAVIVSIGHRDTLGALHDQTLNLEKAA